MKDNKSVAITFLIVAGIVLLALILSSKLGGTSIPSDSVQVSGQASLEATPDLITLIINFFGNKIWTFSK